MPAPPVVEVGPADDRYEREADAVAAQVMRGTNGSASRAPEMRRAPPVTVGHEAGCISCAQRVALDPSNHRHRAPTVSRSALTSGGRPLEAPVRSFYEERLGRDLSSVRVHTGAASVARTHEVDAHAFTYGDHVWLGRDHAPNVSFVMAHELAHVVQQTSPPTTVTTARALSQSQRVIQRLGGAYYIIPTISGATHSNDLQNAMVRQHSVSKEVKIPNATRGSTAAAFSTRRGNRVSGNGAADLYRANKKIGVYFEAGPTGTSCPDGTPAGKPRNMTRGGRPYVNQRARLTGATEAPTEIALGEVKPADPDAMTFATDQLEAYKRGIRFARQKANCWWSANNSASATAPQWNAITLSNMAGLSIPSGWQYSATSTGTNTVAIGTWEGWGNGRIRTRTLFNPATNGLPRIQGRVYAVEADGRPGVYVYFVRPNDPEGLLRSVSGSAQRRAWVTEAGRVQRQVVGPLLDAPKQGRVPAAESGSARA